MFRSSRPSRRPIIGSVLGALFLLRGSLLGQEGAGITFDPRETGERIITWKGALGTVLLAAACGGLWRLLVWAPKSKRSSVDWKKGRIWWPTAMLVWCWALMVLVPRTDGEATWVMLLVFALLNLPAILVGALVVTLVQQTVQAPLWVGVAVFSSILWTTDYLLVRLVEWRAGLNTPVSLHLLDSGDAAGKNLLS